MARSLHRRPENHLMYRNVPRRMLCWALLLTLIFAYAAVPEAHAATSGQLTGIVTRSSGVPASSAVVTARVADTSTIAASTVANVDGWYALTLEPGLYDVLASDGVEISSVVRVEVTEGGAPVANISLLKAYATIRGRLDFGSGSVTNGARLAIEPCGQTCGEVAPDGSFEISRPVGNTSLTVSGTVWTPEAGLLRVYLVLAGIDASHDVDLGVTVVPRHSLTVRVVDDSGLAVAGADVFSFGERPKIASSTGHSWELFGGGGLSTLAGSGSTDANGVVAMTGYFPFEKVSVRYGVSPGVSVVVPAGTSEVTVAVVVVSPALLTLQGAVVLEGGSLTNGASLTVCANNCAGVSGDGSFSLQVQPGSTAVSLGGSVWTPESGTFPISVAAISPLNVTQNVDVGTIFVPRRTLKVRVVDTSGAPVAGAAVSALGAKPLVTSADGSSWEIGGGGMWGTFAASGLTDELGIANLGSYLTFTRVSAQAGTSPAVSFDVLPDAVEVEATVTVVTPARISGFLDLEGADLAGGPDLTVSPCLVGCPARVDAAGMFTASLNPGASVVGVAGSVHPTSGSAPIVFWLGSVGPISVTDTLDLGRIFVPQHTVTVHVVGPSGAPWEGVTVIAMGTKPTVTSTSGHAFTVGGGGVFGNAAAQGVTNAEGAVTLSGYMPIEALIISPKTGPSQRIAVDGSLSEGTVIVGDWRWLPGSSGVADEDSVPSGVEAAVPSLDGGGVGDGNGDAIPDSLQSNVSSLPIPSSGDYMTLAISDTARLTNVGALDPATLATPPGGLTLPSGVFKFQANGLEPGADVVVSLFVKSTEGVNGYAKYDVSSGEWSMLPTDRVVVVDSHRVDVRLSDGGVGDADGQANGVLDDPGALVIAEPDQQAPSITGSATPAANIAGWNNSAVTVNWTVSDPQPSSGVASLPEPLRIESEGSEISVVSSTVCDQAGNCAVGRYAPLRIDLTPPVVTLGGVREGATYVLGATPTPSCMAWDALSGLEGECVLTVSGGTSSGVGDMVATARARDRAGNVTEVFTSFRVEYAWSGFDQPINDPIRSALLPTSVFKAGATVTVKFSLRDAAGRVVKPSTPPSWPLPQVVGRNDLPVAEAVSLAPGDSGWSFRAADDQWVFNWKTQKDMAGKSWRLQAALDDGTVRSVVVGLR